MIKVDKLYRGIFWIKDIESRAAVVIKAECNSNGFFTTVPDFKLLAKSGTEFNHQAAWSTLPKRETGNKPYNYYPRGRVEILGRIEHRSNNTFEFTTWSYANNSLYHGHYFTDYEKAKEDFAVRSGLLQSTKLFTDKEMMQIYRCVDLN